MMVGNDALGIPYKTLWAQFEDIAVYKLSLLMTIEKQPLIYNKIVG